MRPVAQVKRLPDDFQVVEETDVRPSSGEFSLYRLSKRGIGTLEAVDFIARSWNLAPRQIQYGGMKDKHAVTQQFITIRGGPPENFKVANVELVYLGAASRPFGPRDIAGNRFRIVLRRIQSADAEFVNTAIGQVILHGVPNYFDDQRFRSLGPSGEFIARAWCRADYERALWLTLAEENPSDDAGETQQKELLRAAWGRWAEAKEGLTRSHRRSIVTYLTDHPADFRGAFERVRVELRRIYLVAFQSYLWNKFLAEIVAETAPADARAWIPSAFGELPAPAALTEARQEELERVKIPLPSSRARYADATLAARFERVLGDQGLTLATLRVKHGRDAFFPTASRSALLRPKDFESGWRDDELHPGRRALALAFTLPRGSYATIVLKRILAGRGRSYVDDAPIPRNENDLDPEN